MKLIVMEMQSDRVSVELVKNVVEGESAEELLAEICETHLDVTFPESTPPHKMLDTIRKYAEENPEFEICGIVAVDDDANVEVWF